MHEGINTALIAAPDIGQIARDAEILLSQSIQRAPAILQICNGQYYSNICTLGNFSAVKGKAKSKKTFFMTLLMGSALSESLYRGRIQSQLAGKDVVYIDTEQSPFHVWSVMDRICRMNGFSKQPDNLFGYCLRPFDTKMRIDIIENIIYNNDRIGFLVLDGIRDLVKDINSQEEATNIVNMLMRWTHERNIHISTVLHENKADNNLRGHIGTEVANKSETVLSVTRAESNKNISVVEAAYIRDVDFEPFSFMVDQSTDGLPVIIQHGSELDFNREF